jgi:uncharacterized protein (TIGR01777 family)
VKVVVSGSSGLVGRPLIAALEARGSQVVRLVRRVPHKDDAESRWDPDASSVDRSAFESCDAVVNLSGAGIGERRWTPARKRVLVDSRVQATRLLCETIADLARSPRVLVNASAVGYYGDRGDEVLTEQSGPGTGFLSSLCQQWESATAEADRAGIRVVRLRTAVVLAARGGALGRQLPLFRLGLGGRLGSGDQWLSWISLRDHIGAILRSLDDESLSGAVNAASPSPVTNAVFTKSLGRALRRPSFAAVPRPALRAALGRELADEVVLASQRVLPARLEGAGFNFRDPEIEGALKAVLAGG